MATWDAKERQQFKIDAENLKADIDAIQSEKIKALQDKMYDFEVKINEDTVKFITAINNDISDLKRADSELTNKNILTRAKLNQLEIDYNKKLKRSVWFLSIGIVLMGLAVYFIKN